MTAKISKLSSPSSHGSASSLPPQILLYKIKNGGYWGGDFFGNAKLAREVHK